MKHAETSADILIEHLMVTNLEGYELSEKIYDGAYSVVYRGLHRNSGQPVILKSLKTDFPSPPQLARYQHEYEFLRSLNLPGVLRAYSLEKQSNSHVLALEDFGGRSLDRWLADRPDHLFSVSSFLPLAIRVVDSLGQLHQEGVIHRDINPANIVWNAATGQLKLIDFGLATRLAHETPTLLQPLEGTWAYMSPEQTGRMNRSIDYRTDYYSLGITFYELLTGQVPFASDDPIELVHAHMGKTPQPLTEVISGVPPSLSQIVMKLLAKTAEDRYQSTEGLKTDLETCLEQLEATGRIDLFPIAQHDISNRFRIPEKLYGRGDEIAHLLSVFDLVAAGTMKIILYTGEPGIGKSLLVNEIQKPITEKRGYFISGKFDQYKRDIPFSAISKAFQEFARLLLTENEASLRHWRANILQCVGGNGQVITDMIPEFELVIGPQPSVQALPPAEAQNRFQYVFQNFVGAISQQRHPLVLFLDDLQWADPASLTLLKVLITDADNPSFIVIGAYRDNEVDASHPLLLTLQQISQLGVSVESIKLNPLSLEHVNQLVADTLHCTLPFSRPLTELVYEKTQGNPFFVNQFLKSLNDTGLLTFNNTLRSWQWDTAQIRAQDVTDNVVTLMAGSIRGLPAASQTVLGAAACIGNRFDLETLAMIYRQQTTETFQELWQAIAEGLVLPLDNNYKLLAVTAEGQVAKQSTFKFLHDRVQEAAYAMIAEADRQAMHLDIGRLLLASTTSEGLSERLFDVVNHLNRASTLISNSAECTQLAELNLQAAHKAKASTAYVTALNHLTTAIALLPADSWNTAYQLTVDLYVERAECEYLTGNFSAAAELFDLTLSRSRTALEKARIFNLLVMLNNSTAHLKEALDYGKRGLAMLGFHFSDSADEKKAMLGKEFETLQSSLAGLKIEDLANLPELTDPDKTKIIELCANMLPSANMTGDLDLYVLLTLKMVSLSRYLGNSSFSSHAYVMYGVVLATGFGDYESAYRFGELGLTLGRKYQNGPIDTKNLFAMGTWLAFWKQPLKTTAEYLLAAYSTGLESGDLTFAAYSVLNYVTVLTCLGMNVTLAYQEMLKYLPFLQKSKDEVALKSYSYYVQFILNLQGQTEDKYSLSDEHYDEAAEMQQLRDSQNWNLLSRFLLCKLQLWYLYGDYSGALRLVQETVPLINTQAGSFNAPLLPFYHALILSALYPTLPPEEKASTLQTFAAQRQQISLWAGYCPENFRHMDLLLSAEAANIEGRDGEAMTLYDEAIQAAHEHGFTHLEARDNELAAKFYLARGRHKIAAAYLIDAHYLYGLWGATRKVKDLSEQYPQWFAETLTQQGPARVMTSTGSATNAALDLASVLKASQAISREIDFDILLARLITIALENAGAESGNLILELDGKLVVEAFATATSDEVVVKQSIPVDAAGTLCLGIVNYVARTQEPVILTNAASIGMFTADSYVQLHDTKSVLCIPIFHAASLIGLLYFENNLITGAFTPQRLEVLTLLASQIAISLENARLYADLSAERKALRATNLNLQREVIEREQADERYRSIFENAVEGIFRSTPTGSMVTANPGLARILGYASPEEVVAALTDAGRLPYVHSEDHADIVRQLESQGMVQRFETQVYRQDGMAIWVSINAHTVADSDGHIIYFEGIVEDITVLRQAQAELLRAERLQIELAKDKELLDHKERFIAVASHEFRTPLAVISSSAEILEHYFERLTPERRASTLQDIQSQIQYMIELLDHVLLINMAQQGQFSYHPAFLDIDQLCRDIFEQAQTTDTNSAGHTFLFTSEIDRKNVLVDANLLRHILVNLLSNAVKYSPEGGQIRFELIVQDEEAIFRIHDQGIGIPVADQERIFEPFHRAKNAMATSGTGLGLAIIKESVQAHGGMIAFESNEGIGTIFTVKLPTKLYR